MRIPTRTAAGLEQEKHYKAVKDIVGDLSMFNGLNPEDFEVYRRFTGTPEAVAARIIAARQERAGK